MPTESQDRRIMKAALKLFHEHGYEGVSVSQIGARCNLSGPAIYRYFSGKEEILASLLDSALDGLTKLTGRHCDDPAEELVLRTRAHVRYVIKQRVLMSVWQRDGRALPEAHRRRLRRREQEYLDDWIGCVTRCHPNAAADDVTIAVYGALSVLATAGSWPRSVLQLNHLEESLVELILTCFRSLGHSAPGLREIRAAGASPAGRPHGK